MALGARAVYVDVEDVHSQEKDDSQILANHQKSIPFTEFFTGYRRTALPSTGILTKIVVPLELEDGTDSTLKEQGWTEKSFTRSYKQAKRKDDDIAIVNCCLNVTLSIPPASTASSPLVSKASLVYGGMAPTTTSAFKTEKFLVGKPFFSQATLSQAIDCIGEDFPLPYSVPGGMATYRRTLAMGFFCRFFSQVRDAFQWKFGGNDLLEGEKSALARVEEIGRSELHRPVTRAAQDLEDVDVDFRSSKKTKGSSGESVPHLSALKQCTGEAQYLDDIPHYPTELYGAIVFSTKPHAKLVSVDPSEALRLPGVTHFVDIDDIPEGGSNVWCPVSEDCLNFDLSCH